LDIFAKLIGKIHFCLTFFNIRSIEPLHIILIENSRLRLYVFQFGSDTIQNFLFQYPDLYCRLIHVIREDIPASENQIIKIG